MVRKRRDLSVALPAFWSALKDVCARFPRRAEVALEWSEDTPTGSLLTDPRKMTVMVRNLVNNALSSPNAGACTSRSP